jgi:hypothetical protein
MTMPHPIIPASCTTLDASMLALLKLWRTVTELKLDHGTFQEAFKNFFSNANETVRTTVRNIKFFHECARPRSAQERCVSEDLPIDEWPHNMRTLDEDVNEDTHDESSVDKPVGLDKEITEEQITHTLDRPFSSHESLYTDIAIEIGMVGAP